MVEYVEKDILCTRLARKQLNIINNQYIDYLVKMDEIVAIVLFDGFYVLLSEFFS